MNFSLSLIGWIAFFMVNSYSPNPYNLKGWSGTFFVFVAALSVIVGGQIDLQTRD